MGCDKPKFPVARRFSGHLQALRVKCPKFLDPDVVTLAAVRTKGLAQPWLKSWSTSYGIPKPKAWEQQNWLVQSPPAPDKGRRLQLVASKLQSNKPPPYTLEAVSLCTVEPIAISL